MPDDPDVPNESSPGHEDEDDVRLFEELKVLIRRTQGPPPEVADAAREALTWRNVDAELLAVLSYDSSEEEEEAEKVRGAEDARLLILEAPGFSVELEVVTPGGGRCHLRGQLMPPHPGEVQVRQRSGSRSVMADDLGRFAARDVPAEPFQLVCRFDDGAPWRVVGTDWVLP